MENDKIVVIDETGKEIEMEVLFTFDSDDMSKQYVVYFDPSDPSSSAYVSSYTEDGKLEEIVDEKEWEFVNEVFETFVASDLDAQAEGCGCGCHHDHDHDHHDHCGCGHDH